MEELLIAAQMKAIEQAAIESGVVTGLELMERAGQGVVEAIFEEWPELTDAPAAGAKGGVAPSASGIHPQDISRQKKRRAVVLFGLGNNGGDGFVVARLLHGLGWEVEVFLYGEADKLPPNARVNYVRWLKIGKVTIKQIDPPPLVEDSLSHAIEGDIIVDALFGIGLTRPFKGIFYAFTQSILRNAYRKMGVRFVAIDIPSGLASDTGEIIGHAIEADLTVTFHQLKIGHAKGQDPTVCGKTVLKGIGL